jgi:hypothetical protein
VKLSRAKMGDISRAPASTAGEANEILRAAARRSRRASKLTPKFLHP